VLVRGTVIDNLLTVIALIGWVGIVAYTAIYTYRRFDIGEKDEDATMAWIFAIVLFAVILAFVINIIQTAVIGATMPEYAVMNKALQLATE